MSMEPKGVAPVIRRMPRQIARRDVQPPTLIRSHRMSSILLLVGPLAVVFGALLWVMSFHSHQQALDAETLKMRGSK
jgi:hypothetical protein